MKDNRHLVIDEGNTRLKAAVFNRGEPEETLVFTETGPEFLSWYLARSACPTIISSVKKKALDGVILAGKNLTLNLSHNTPLPIKNRYLTPETLGPDRLANACGAALLYPGRNVLVLDCGTCLKADFINAANEYLGGSIAPGLTMRLQAMHTFTGKLPFIEPAPVTRLYGRDTRESLLAGAWGGMRNEMDGTIDKYRDLYPDLVVVLTGGDAGHFEGALKNSIFANSLITLYGLEHILQHQTR